VSAGCSQAAGARWLVLNLLVMVVGWFVIVVGIARFSARGAIV
jgi:hypothetical protein